VRVAAAAAQWIQHTQRERGWSNRWLTVGDPVAWAGVQRSRRDAQHSWQHWQLAVEALAQHSHAEAWPALWGAVADMADASAPLQSLREHIDTRTSNWLLATSRWTSAIAAMLHVQAELGWVLGETADARLLAVWLTLIRFKELCGQERAVGSALMGEPEVDEAQRQWLATLVERQDELRGALVRAKVLPPLENDPWMHELVRLRRCLVEGLARPELTTEAVQRWFDACTRRIDALHDIEVRWYAGLTGAVAENPRRDGEPTPIPIEDLRVLRQRLSDQRWIDRAKAELITLGATEAQAHQTLRRLAMDRRVTFADAARWIIATGGV
jgi:hypothetical protein